MPKQPDLTIPESATEALDLVAPLIERFGQVTDELVDRNEELEVARYDADRLWAEYHFGGHDPKNPGPEVPAALRVAEERKEKALDAYDVARAAFDSYKLAAMRAALAYIVRVLAANPKRVVGLKPFCESIKDLLDRLAGDAGRAGGWNFVARVVSSEHGITLCIAVDLDSVEARLCDCDSEVVTEQELKRAEGNLIVYGIEDVEAALAAARDGRDRVRALMERFEKYAEAHNAEVDAILEGIRAIPEDCEIVKKIQGCMISEC